MPFSHRKPTGIWPYVVALAAVAAAALADWLAFYAAGARPLFLFFIPPVVFAAALGGWLPGLLAWALGLGASFAALAGDGLHQADIAAASLFTIVSLLLTWFGHRLYVSRHRLMIRGQELDIQEAQLRAILEMVPEAVTVIDSAGMIRFFSPTAERLFGHAAPDIIGTSVNRLMAPVEGERHDQFIQRYLNTGQAHILGRGRPVSARRADGTTFPIDLFVGDFDYRGETYFVSFMRDLTDREERETRLRELQAELVHMSRLSALGEMASSLAHELNQPLSAIANYLRGCHRLLMSDKPPPPEALREALGKAADQTLRAGNIVRSLREFVSRGDNEHSLVSLGESIKESSQLALVGAKERGIETHFSLDPQADEILADKVQIQQVLLNLIRNAVEAMEDRPRRQLVVTSKVVDDMIIVSVADTGGGIAPDIQAKLFQPFVTSKSRGMGVGLSICRTIIEAHGGRIWAEDAPDGGTIFKFSLPRVPKGEVDGA